uniref:Uncharacterized protein n=1 Tax=viral metagenome TaxID=1070528 RepID=A0A6C0LUP2_9ZZZZ
MIKTIDTTYLLYFIINTFKTLGISLCEDTQRYIKNVSKKFDEMEIDKKLYYSKYALQIVKNLNEYIEEIKILELNIRSTDSTIIHDIRLISKIGTCCISLQHDTINIKDIIPNKLMKICKYKKNTDIAKKYTEMYEKINNIAFQKIKIEDKYSNLSDEVKESKIYRPLCNLIMDTLSKKRKCANNLYNHLFSEKDRIVLKLYKNRFVLYDFDKEHDEIKSFKINFTDPNKLNISFNNGAYFELKIKTNAIEIKEHISVKFKTHFKNIDDMFAINSSTI